METIRRATEKDTEAIDRLLFAVQKVHSDARPDLFRAGSKKYTDAQLTKIINNDETPVFVYENDGNVRGYAFCVFVKNDDSGSFNPIKTLYIDDLCVDASERGNGIGKKLYEYVLNFAKNSGCYNLTLNVWADNVKAVGFYKALGLNVQKMGMEKIL